MVLWYWQEDWREKKPYLVEVNEEKEIKKASGEKIKTRGGGETLWEDINVQEIENEVLHSRKERAESRYR